MKKNQSIKVFVEEHKVGLAVAGTFVATAAFCLYLNRLALSQHTDFLKGKGLLDEFYELEE